MPFEPWDDAYARRRVALAEEQLSGLDALPDGLAAARAAQTVETLVGLYGQCLGRITAQLAEHPDVLDRLAADDLVGHLLLVHDLHPHPVGTRVRQALAALPEPPKCWRCPARRFASGSAAVVAGRPGPSRRYGTPWPHVRRRSRTSGWRARARPKR